MSEKDRCVCMIEWVLFHNDKLIFCYDANLIFQSCVVRNIMLAVKEQIVEGCFCAIGGWTKLLLLLSVCLRLININHNLAEVVI